MIPDSKKIRDQDAVEADRSDINLLKRAPLKTPHPNKHKSATVPPPPLRIKVSAWLGLKKATRTEMEE